MDRRRTLLEHELYRPRDRRELQRRLFKEALLNVPFEMPFRGPEHYEHGDYAYRCTVSGGFEWFQGHESILNKGVEIYDCYFHGGLIK